MRERGILFSAPMVRAILAGKKTQTRRVIQAPRVMLPSLVHSELYQGSPGIIARPDFYDAELNPHGAVSINVNGKMLGVKPGEFHFVCPFIDGQTGLMNNGHRSHWTILPHAGESVRLWVKETFRECGDIQRSGKLRERFHDSLVYRADSDDTDGPWRPSIFMPRWASRLLLDVVSVRVERLTQINEADAQAEGVASVDEYAKLWNSINGKSAPWSSDPWVWVINFKPLQRLGAP